MECLKSNVWHCMLETILVQLIIMWITLNHDCSILCLCLLLKYQEYLSSYDSQNKIFFWHSKLDVPFHLSKCQKEVRDCVSFVVLFAFTWVAFRMQAEDSSLSFSNHLLQQVFWAKLYNKSWVASTLSLVMEILNSIQGRKKDGDCHHTV